MGITCQERWQSGCGLNGTDLVQDSVEGRSDVVDVDVAPPGGAITVDTALIALKQPQHELRDYLLRVLHGPVDVVTPGDYHRHVVGPHVGLAHKLSGCLGARVGVGGLENGIFQRSLPEVVPVDLVGRHVHKELDLAVRAGTLEKSVRAEDVCLGVDEGISKLACHGGIRFSMLTRITQTREFINDRVHQEYTNEA